MRREKSRVKGKIENCRLKEGVRLGIELGGERRRMTGKRDVRERGGLKRRKPEKDMLTIVKTNMSFYRSLRAKRVFTPTLKAMYSLGNP